MVLDGVSERNVVVARSGDIAVLDERVMHVSVERLLHFGDALDGHDPAHADLLALVVVALHARHLEARHRMSCV